MKSFLASLLVLLSTFCMGQEIHLATGTDIPYQHYTGLHFSYEKMEVYYRTGILAPPYSDAILSIVESLGVDNVYIRLLDGSYDFGWMNGLGVNFKLGENKNWYLGPELRYDYLTASETPAELIELVTGRTINAGIGRNEAKAELGVGLFAVGARFGRAFEIGENKKNQLRLEISVSKHMASSTRLTINNQRAENLTRVLDDLLWEDVFKDYGFVGGVGISYVRRL